ncbi:MULTISPECIES: ParA family protein [Phaeobacter]|uniref:ATPase involved in chromosome partitioning n=3 Tax=Phaeobacter TaxID=302485 RepID=A0AAC9ZC78_9RHOB|nr:MULTISPECIES: ParA family protein [Phaeobacter]AHD12046.1 ATPase involved in chromosome partitioning [Phaeobacter gallaeciensis DSM 26640]ATE99521.1 ATPase involved in chromosome partitioning [Phaeobacter gallaeciensis]ATF08111.1 ATPase involved in chromosome partitioning [Phaeobacter gallaeciensis]ATG45840.1 ATPase involved in chromosome partitioning [Phaeobacter piscinae]AUR01782.1 ATPase involved in chromosome partitioning [Phaeobacter inhibens]
MKVITLIQTKGGSGKTTLAMTIASAALAKGQKVQMFDGDVNKQLLSWQPAYMDADWGHVEKPDWPEHLQIDEPPENVEALYERLEQLEESGTDLVIFDTRPGSYESTEDYAIAADMVLIPARPAQAEWRLVLSAFEWMAELQATLAKNERFPQVRSVIANVPTKIIQAAAGVGKSGSLPKRDKEVLDNILQTPHLDTMIPNSRILEHLLYHGPLPVAENAHRQARAGTLMANNFEDLTQIAVSLYDEIIEGTKE